MKEIRVAEIRAITSPAGEDKHIITGRPIVYETPTVINDPNGGSYTEIIKQGALNNADLSDVHLLYNHDLSKVPLARTPKTMQLKVDDNGLTFTAELPDTAAAMEVYEAIKRGDLSGMSFAFKVPDGGDSYDAMTNTRSIYSFSKVYECSIVPFPAYPTTSVEARNAQAAAKADYIARNKAKILVNQILLSEV